MDLQEPKVPLESAHEHQHEVKHNESSPELEAPAIIHKSSSSSSSDPIIEEAKEIIEAQVEQVRNAAVAGLNTYISQAKDAMKQNKYIIGGITIALAAVLALKKYKKRS